MSKQIGERIRRFSKSKGFNQAYMAKEIGITPGAYAKIERGETDPSISRLYEIAAVLQIDILQLLEDIPREKQSPVTRAEFDNLQTLVNFLRKAVEKLTNEK